MQDKNITGKKVVDWICPECEHNQFHYDHIRAELYCTTCGLVVRGMVECGIVYPELLPVYEDEEGRDYNNSIICDK